MLDLEVSPGHTEKHRKYVLCFSQNGAKLKHVVEHKFKIKPTYAMLLRRKTEIIHEFVDMLMDKWDIRKVSMAKADDLPGDNDADDDDKN